MSFVKQMEPLHEIVDAEVIVAVGRREIVTRVCEECRRSCILRGKLLNVYKRIIQQCLDLQFLRFGAIHAAMSYFSERP